MPLTSKNKGYESQIAEYVLYHKPSLLQPERLLGLPFFFFCPIFYIYMVENLLITELKNDEKRSLH